MHRTIESIYVSHASHEIPRAPDQIISSLLGPVSILWALITCENVMCLYVVFGVLPFNTPYNGVRLLVLDILIRIEDY